MKSVYIIKNKDIQTAPVSRGSIVRYAYMWRMFGLLAFVSHIYAQSTPGIAINASGNSNYAGAILDLSNQNTNGTTGFLPPYVSLTSATVLAPVSGTAAQLSGLLVYNISTSTSSGLSGPGLYFWNNTLSPPAWVYMGAAASADNGLSVSGSAVQLGGNNLIQATNIPLNGYNLSIAGSSVATNFTTTGQVGIGNASPNAEAVVDLTNTSTNWGLMLPGMSTANLPAITTAQNGLMVFNTTIGCPEIVVGGTWFVIGATHGSQSFAYTGSTQTLTIPSCIATVTIVANGASGGDGEGGGGVVIGGWGTGATVIANTIAVTPGEILDIICGQEGDGYSEGYLTGYVSGGGGGATFVWNSASTTIPIVIAGGGGGGAGTGSNGADASITTIPNESLYLNAGSGGSGGNGGTAGTGAESGGGGGGWLSAGSPASATVHLGKGGGTYSTFLGGTGASDGGGAGGYGGGGGAGASTSNAGGGGGGGGYNGGGGGNGSTSYASEYGAEGGGSCVNGANPTSASIGWNGNGSVTIYW